MTRPHLLASTAPLAAVAYASQPLAPGLAAAVSAVTADGNQDADWFEKRDADSAHMLPYWERVDAILDGIEGMKLRATEFLPKFRDEDDEDYRFRTNCTKFTNVYLDIVEGLSSKPFEQMVQLVSDQTDATDDTGPDGIPDAIKQFQWDVDGSGNNLTVFAAQTFFNGINHALDWILIDHEKRDPNVRSIADARARNIRPYWSHILARNVLKVESRIEGSKEVITYAKILEPGDPQDIREFTRYDVNGQSSVTWKLWRKITPTTGGKQQYQLVDSGDVSIGIIPLVPFVTGRREGRRWRFMPPMRAAVELSVNLFKQESELEYKSTMSAYSMLSAPTPPPMGPDGKTPNTKIIVGPSRVLWPGNRNDGGPQGKWEWIEPSSEILKFLESRVASTIQNLRELGRQPLTASSSNITVITAAVAAGKAKSAVKAWAFNLKDTLENCLLITAKWMALDYDPTVHVFAEFDDWMEGEDLDSLLRMHESGAISTQTLHEEMQRRGVLSSNFTTERETKRLLAQLPRDGVDTTENE